jgi:hypothetical protein
MERSFTPAYTDPTEEEAAQVRALIESLDRIQRMNSSLLEIINEEAAPYFAGDKTAREVAAIIQDRISIYLSERA